MKQTYTEALDIPTLQGHHDNSRAITYYLFEAQQRAQEAMNEWAKGRPLLSISEIEGASRAMERALSLLAIEEIKDAERHAALLSLRR